MLTHDVTNSLMLH